MGRKGRATEADPTSVAAFYNLSQAYSLKYDFDKSDATLARAQQLDNAQVEAWNAVPRAPEESGVAVDGGLDQIDAILARLRRLWRSDESLTPIELWRRHFSLSVVLATLLLAVTLHMARLQLGYRSSLLEEEDDEGWAESPWARAIVPGLASAVEGRGGRAFVAVLVPMGLVMLPLLRGVGYREPLGYDPGHWLPMVTSAVFLTLWLLSRIGWELSSDR